MAKTSTEAVQRWRADLRARGLCQQCGTRPVKVGRRGPTTRCADCTSKAAAYQKTRMARRNVDL
jgi:ribosomal protein S14